MPNVSVSTSIIMSWLRPGNTLGPRPPLANPDDTPPAIQLTGYVGSKFLTPVDPFVGVDPGGTPPTSAVIVPVFPDTAGTRCVLVWEDDIVAIKVIDTDDGQTVLWVRDDAITRNLEFETPQTRVEHFLEGKIADIINAGSVTKPSASAPWSPLNAPGTWGEQCAASVRRSYCGKPC